MRKKALQAFTGMLRELKSGGSVIVTADVPKISRVAGLGIVTLAKHSQCPILPVAMATSRLHPPVELGPHRLQPAVRPHGRGARGRNPRRRATPMTRRSKSARRRGRERAQCRDRARLRDRCAKAPKLTLCAIAVASALRRGRELLHQRLSLPAGRAREGRICNRFRHRGTAHGGEAGASNCSISFSAASFRTSRTSQFKDLNQVEIVGLYPNYATAYAAWKSKAQGTVDNAHMRYFIVHLHRLLDPDTDTTRPKD